MFIQESGGLNDSAQWTHLGTAIVTNEQWKLVQVQHCKRNRKLVGDWIEILRDSLKQLDIKCLLHSDLRNNYCPSDRSSANIFHYSIARCRFKKCRLYKFVIINNPVVGEQVLVDCYAIGTINHAGGNLREGIRGQKRKALGQRACLEGPSRVFHELMGQLDPSDVAPGNISNAPSKAALSMMASELKRSKFLSPDPLTDLQMLSEDLQKFAKNGIGEHYIRPITVEPPETLIVPLFSTGQLRFYLGLQTAERGPFLYLDATGSVVTRTKGVPQKKPIYYYALVGRKDTTAVPVAELISSDHTWPTLVQWLNKFWYELYKIDPKARKPAKIESDFSWPILLAIPKVFDSTDLKSYLGKCFEILANPTSPQEITVLHICCAHMIHTMARRLAKAHVSEDKREMAMRAFAVLQNCTSLAQAREAFSHISKLFLSEFNGDHIELAVRYLRNFKFDSKDDAATSIEGADDERRERLRDTSLT